MEARNYLRHQIPALILLDIGLPDGNGLELCAELQGESPTREIPIIFLTGQGEVAHKVTAFAMGAEDYLVKPFSPLELKARLEARLKKLQNKNGSGSTICRGMLEIDAATQRVFRLEGSIRVAISLTPKEFKLLFHLARFEDRVFSRDQLLTLAWTDAQVYDRTVDTHISAIRKKLGHLSEYIESISGEGYRFTTTIKRAA